MNNAFSFHPIRRYGYVMGFAVNGTALPDPSFFSGSDSPIESNAGDRDATGRLHSTLITTKHPLKLEWSALDWGMLMEILPLVKEQKFMFTYPDPCTGEMQTIEARAENRDWGVAHVLEDGTYVGKLSFSVIEF